MKFSWYALANGMTNSRIKQIGSYSKPDYFITDMLYGHKEQSNTSSQSNQNFCAKVILCGNSVLLSYCMAIIKAMDKQTKIYN